MDKKIKLAHWTPRILCMAAILFVSMFALDAFSPGVPFWQQLTAFAIHLIPSFIMLFMLVIAWRWERLGGILFLMIGVGFSPVIFYHNFQMNHSVAISLGIIATITFPFILVGLLFLRSYKIKHKNC